DDEQASIVDGPGDELQQQEGRCVRPLEVVEDQQEGLGLRCSEEERGRCLEQAEACPFRVARKRQRELPEEFVELGKELGEVRCASAELVAEQPRIATAHIGT